MTDSAKLKNQPALIWKYEPGTFDYAETLQLMEETVKNISQNNSPETIWCLEHPPVFTAGTSAKEADLTNDQKFPVHYTGRGGQFTYHGPGQLVVYVMLDFNKRGKDIKAYVQSLEQWIINCLSHFNIKAEQRSGRVGLWVTSPDGIEEKIAAIGVRMTKWVSWHGLSINVNPNLSHFSGIVPCGLQQFGVTSFEKLGIYASVEKVQLMMKKTCPF